MRRAFAHDGLAISVDAPEADITWLEEFLWPAFDVVAAEPAAARVSFESAADPGVESPGTGERAAFTLDAAPIRLPESPITGGTRLRDAIRAVTFDVTDGGRDVRIRYAASPLDARMRLMRVVREYAHNHSVRNGGLMLHAAAISIDGRAVAIAGPKGAGKTTLALRLLAMPGVSYVSNDRLLVRDDRALAVPTVVALREGTRTLMPELAARLRDCGDFRQHPEERRARGPSAPIVIGETWHVSPRQLCAALDRPLLASAPLAALVFLTPDRSGPRPVRRLSTVEAAEALKSARLCRHSRHTSDVFVTGPGSDPANHQVDAWCQAVASRVVCVACAWRGDAAADVVPALLDACIEQRR